MALSTKSPSASMREKSTTILSVVPVIFKNKIPISIDSGIASPTNEAFLSPRKNSSTNTTSMTPEMILFSRLLTSFRVFSL